MGKLLKIIYERQLDGAFATLEDGLEIARADRRQRWLTSYVCANIDILNTYHYSF
jgi:hypothetical protein